MLKETRYANGIAQGCVKGGVVKYMVQHKNCIFSGVTSSREFTSTVNAAEYVIQAIAEAEGLDPREIRFFDLCTRLGYPSQEASHEFMQLTVQYEGAQPHVIGWEPTPCSPQTLQLFGVVEH